MRPNRERSLAKQDSQARVGVPQHAQKRSWRDIVGLETRRPSRAARREIRAHALAGSAEPARGAVEEVEEQAGPGIISIVIVSRCARQESGFRVGS